MARKPTGGLTKWFKEDWRDVKTGKKCGRSGKKDKGDLTQLAALKLNQSLLQLKGRPSVKRGQKE